MLTSIGVTGELVVASGVGMIPLFLFRDTAGDTFFLKKHAL